jgi:hypothetical protein
VNQKKIKNLYENARLRIVEGFSVLNGDVERVIEKFVNIAMNID